MPRKGQVLGKYSRTETIDVRRMKRLIERCPSLDYKALFALLWLTGCRISEALNLKKSDFSLRGGELVIKLKRLKRKDGLVSEVCLPLEVCHYILQHLQRVKSKVWTFSRVDAWKMLKSLDNGLTLHDFRRHRCNFMAENKATLWQMLSFFGWKSTSTPLKYLESKGALGRELSPLLLKEGTV